MSPVAVADSLSNREEHIVELAKRIGVGQKREVFREVYRGQKQAKTVAEIAAALDLREIQVLKVGVELVAAHAVQQVTISGRVGYAKIPAHKAIKDKVLKIAGNKAVIARIATKRNRYGRERQTFHSDATQTVPKGIRFKEKEYPFIPYTHLDLAA